MTIPSYFQLTGAPVPDRSPPGAHDDWLAVLRHHRHVTGQHRTQPRTRAGFHVVADVWDTDACRHLWRSWPVELGETATDWTERTHGIAMSDHDNGPWAVPGLTDVGEWPIPTDAALRETLTMTLPVVRGALLGLCAVATLPGGGVDWARPIECGDLPSMTGLYQMGAERKFVSWSLTGALGTTHGFRAHVLAADPVPDTPPDAVTWRVVLVDRVSGASVTETFQEPPTASPRALSAAARRVLGIVGIPSQRRHGTLTWRLAGATREFTISREGDEA